MTNPMTQRPTSMTLLISIVLLAVGFLDTILNVISLPNNLGIWAMFGAGFLLIVGSLIDNI
ncbi:hypothetical protein JR338_11045 [Chloroflexota bacterium]|nr:hypothetical protein JR338_11045 [Chloroflexota bacterium]